MVKKNKLIIIIIVFFVCILKSNNNYAKYKYKISMNAFNLSRDISNIEYKIEKSVSDSVYTNEDIILKIITNKEIEMVPGFELDDTKRILTKIIKENETEDIILEDFSGNKQNVNYSINNIDKVPPEIIGLNDDEIYSRPLKLDYKDNIGIKEILVDRYNDSLEIYIEQDYYDAGFLKGTYVLGEKIFVDVTSHPKGTAMYRFYLDNNLVCTTTKSEYTYTNLRKAFTYNLLVQAVDKNGNVIASKSQNVKAKTVSNISSVKNNDSITITLSGIGSAMSAGYCALWNDANVNNKKVTYPSINNDRTLTISFSAYDIDGIKRKGYYYLHLQLYCPYNPDYNEIIAMNIVFDGLTYVKKDDDNIDINNLEYAGNYDIKVIDLAGNITQRTIKVK